jgi:CTP synthase (UTP-ammonia lyase)
VVLEYARSVLGFADAAHAEYDPYASELFITALSCSLVRRTMTVAVRANTMAARLYQSSSITEKYYCNFGLNLETLAGADRRRFGRVRHCQWPPTTTLSAPPATFNPDPYPDPTPT